MYSNQEMSAFENNILNMDCIDFLKNCPDKYFDLVLTDPPYLIKQYNGTYNSKLAKRALKNKIVEISREEFSDYLLPHIILCW